MEPNTRAELQLDNEELRRQNATLREEVKALDEERNRLFHSLTGELSNALHLRDEIAALKANRWGAFSDGELHTLSEAMRSDPDSSGTPLCDDIGTELARREVGKDG